MSKKSKRAHRNERAKHCASEGDAASRRKKVWTIAVCLIVILIAAGGIFAGWNAAPAPNAPQPTPSPTPVLAKEYIYAGSRLLATEEPGAAAATATDLAVWRMSTGTWYVLGGQTGTQST